MSLTDREQHTTLPARTPDTPGLRPPAPAEPKPYKHLFVAAVALVVVAILGAIGILALNDRRSNTQAVPPAVTATSTTAPSASATLTDREQAALAAEAGYKAYVGAFDESTNAGGGNKLPPALADTVTGPMREQIFDSLKRYKSEGFKTSGSAVAYARTDSLSALTERVPEAKLVTCLDQTGVTVTKEGKAYKGKPDYLREQVTMHREKGTWRVYESTNEVWTGGACADALGPLGR